MTTLALTALGAVFGYGLYRVVGCSTGMCPLTANPFVSTAYGAVMGFLASLGSPK